MSRIYVILDEPTRAALAIARTLCAISRLTCAIRLDHNLVVERDGRLGVYRRHPTDWFGVHSWTDPWLKA